MLRTAQLLLELIKPSVHISRFVKPSHIGGQYYLRHEFYIHGSVHCHSILIRSNKIQHMQAFIYCKITLHVSGVYRTYHQEYIKL